MKLLIQRVLGQDNYGLRIQNLGVSKLSDRLTPSKPAQTGHREPHPDISPTTTLAPLKTNACQVFKKILESLDS